MKYIFLVLIVLLIISCNKENDNQNPPLLASISRDTLLIHYLGYDENNKLTKFQTHYYHLHITPDSSYWTTWYEFISFEYDNDRIEKMSYYTNDGNNLNGYELIEYDDNGRPVRINDYNNSGNFLYYSDLIYNNEDRLEEFTYQFDGYRQHRRYEYEGDNVSSLIFYSDAFPDQKTIYQIEYDTKRNPLIDPGIISNNKHYSDFLESEFVSKNNISKYTCIKPDNSIESEVTFNYKYNDLNYPMWREETSKYYFDSISYTTFIDTLFYHYIVVD